MGFASFFFFSYLKNNIKILCILVAGIREDFPKVVAEQIHRLGGQRKLQVSNRKSGPIGRDWQQGRSPNSPVSLPGRSSLSLQGWQLGSWKSKERGL
jgi:hypothetical protein